MMILPKKNETPPRMSLGGVGLWHNSHNGTHRAGTDQPIMGTLLS